MVREGTQVGIGTSYYHCQDEQTENAVLWLEKRRFTIIKRRFMDKKTPLSDYEHAAF